MTSGRTLLLVGEHAAQLEDAVRRLGFSPVVLEDPVAALEGLSQTGVGDISLVVCDLHLETLETRDFLRRAQTIAPAPSYLLLADPAESGVIVSNMIHGADGYIPTPVDPEHLSSALRRHCAAARGRLMEPGAKDRVLEELERLRTSLATVERERDLLVNRNAELNVSIEQLLDEVRDMVATRKGGGVRAGGPQLRPLDADEADEGTETIPATSGPTGPTDRKRSLPTVPQYRGRAGVPPPQASDWSESETRAERLPQTATDLDSEAATGDDEFEAASPRPGYAWPPRKHVEPASSEEVSAPTALLPAVGNLSLVREELSALFDSESESSGSLGLFESPSEAALFEHGDNDPIARPPRRPTKNKPGGSS